MLMLRTNPVGINYSIQRLQEHLYQRLQTVWDFPVHKCYGRCYRNRREGGYVAEVYDGLNGEYRDVYWDDAVDAVSFFGLSDSIDDVVRQNVQVHLVFFVNLDKIKPNAGERMDEEVRVDVLRAVGKTLYGFHYEGCELGIDRVLREYRGSLRSPSMARLDMHPIHCFRFNYSLTYNPFQTPLKLN